MRVVRQPVHEFDEILVTPAVKRLILELGATVGLEFAEHIAEESTVRGSYLFEYIYRGVGLFRGQCYYK